MSQFGPDSFMRATGPGVHPSLPLAEHAGSEREEEQVAVPASGRPFPSIPSVQPKPPGLRLKSGRILLVRLQ
jgi:hypothetical protein